MTEQSVTRFWDKYIDKTKRYEIKDSAVRWHVRHAEAYIKAHSKIRLADHTEQHVERYLKAKDSKNRLEGWQFNQLVI